MKRVAIWFSSRMHLVAKCVHVESKERDNMGVILNVIISSELIYKVVSSNYRSNHFHNFQVNIVKIILKIPIFLDIKIQ